ncbi:MAG: DUF2270 domain-containing protein [Anaerolineales bacterium]
MGEAQEAAGAGEQPAAENRGSKDSVWSYRGYDLRPSDFSSAMVHLFRGEIQRSNVWRTRLDSTTNWAIITTTAAVSFAFSEPQGNHIVLILSAMLISILLFIEARRYRYYELWSSRVRLMETDFFATMLVPPFHPSSDWAEALAENLLQPHFTVSIREALGRRLRRNYIYILAVLVFSWLIKLWLHPVQAESLLAVVKRAAIGTIPGELVSFGFLGYFTLLLIFGVTTARLQQATGEVLPPLTDEEVAVSAEESPFEDKEKEARDRAWFRRSSRRQQYICLIITDQAQKVAEGILAEMHRGVTAMQGTGMYTGEKHQVLMTALTKTEVGEMKTIIGGIDPGAFVVVSPAEEVLGRGFVSLD